MRNRHQIFQRIKPKIRINYQKWIFLHQLPQWFKINHGLIPHGEVNGIDSNKFALVHHLIDALAGVGCFCTGDCEPYSSHVLALAHSEEKEYCY